MSVKNNTQVVTGKVRLAFPNIFTPVESLNGGDLRYSVTVIIPKSNTRDIEAIKAAIQAAAQAGVNSAFNGKMPTVIKNTLKDGDTDLGNDGIPLIEKYPEYKNSYVIRLSTKFKPKVLNADTKEEIMDTSEVYSGVMGRVSMQFFAYNNKGNAGVSARLSNVAIYPNEGEHLGSFLTGEEFDD